MFKTEKHGSATCENACLSMMGRIPYWHHEAVLSEEGAFPAVHLPDTRHSLPCSHLLN